jgi:hypothetical protein
MLPERTGINQDFFGNKLQVGDWVWIVDSDDQPSMYSGITSRSFFLAKITSIDEEYHTSAVLTIKRYIVCEDYRNTHQDERRINLMALEKVFASQVIKYKDDNTDTTQDDAIEISKLSLSGDGGEFNEDLL